MPYIWACRVRMITLFTACVPRPIPVSTALARFFGFFDSLVMDVVMRSCCVYWEVGLLEPILLRLTLCWQSSANTGQTPPAIIQRLLGPVPPFRSSYTPLRLFTDAAIASRKGDAGAPVWHRVRRPAPIPCYSGRPASASGTPARLPQQASCPLAPPRFTGPK
jgi:hypothetical protein